MFCGDIMKKLALIIGNSNYPNEGKLTNPINDAQDINTKFSELNIDTLLHTDVNNAEFLNAINDYIEQLKNYEIGIFYFAGHGMQIEGENYLCAINTDFSSEGDAKYSSIPLDLILDKLKNTPVYTKILILDACRNNPYQHYRSNFNKGLAPINAPLGTFISFATSPGEVASDGNMKNGPFIKAFLEHVGVADLKIEEVFKRTRNTLYSLTNSKQISWEHTSLMGDFYFKTSHLTGEFDTNYDSNALSDKDFDLFNLTETIKIIKLLKSQHWNTQNTALKFITNDVLEEGSKEELFVLGRNIYQSALGGAWNMEHYIENLQLKLSNLSEEISFHLLNGIIYEIYFNNEGKLREIFKSYYIPHVIPLLKENGYKENGLFLKEKLDEYDFRVIYDVTGIKDFVFEIITDFLQEEELYSVKEIWQESKNILFNENGDDNYEHQQYETKQTCEEIQKIIACNIGAPPSKIKCIFTNLPSDINELKFPYSGYFKLLKYHLK